MDGAVIHWMWKKQTSVSLSTMEVEFTSASNVGRELLGLRELVNEIGFPLTESMVMELDNQAAIRQLESEDSMNRAKHVDIRAKLIRNFAKRGIVMPDYVESRLMMADLLTKGATRPQVYGFGGVLNLA
uniref:Uncharacterized protein AlNc14C698G12415 n=1 Tax=Albugo laibachii Nc14 TaxID=890382 RepID=F0X1V2_9STRA|nr:PREDICTED: hypothetical protein [Albugo laibachii Nc14]|eukprot:CCA27808.1 PREDICTED: hypothetical protein [Albugo laibachii Nc14]